MSYRARHNPAPFLARSHAVIRVTVQKAMGSTPREAGAWMLVSDQGAFGTIGGGALEYMAIDRARALLAEPASTAGMELPLGPEIGQCCGGRVALRLETLDADAQRALVEAAQAQHEALPAVLIYGAGHVGDALARALALAPVRAVQIDSRPDAFPQPIEGVEQRLTPLPEAEVRAARAGDAHLIMTHDHSLDFLIAREALVRGDAALVGMIGSRTKRAGFERWLQRETGSRTLAAKLICPIGRQAAGKTSAREKRPEVIAAFAAAEALAHVTAFERRTAVTPPQTQDAARSNTKETAQ